MLGEDHSSLIHEVINEMDEHLEDDPAKSHDSAYNHHPWIKSGIRQKCCRSLLNQQNSICFEISDQLHQFYENHDLFLVLFRGIQSIQSMPPPISGIFHGIHPQLLARFHHCCTMVPYFAVLKLLSKDASLGVL